MRWYIRVCVLVCVCEFKLRPLLHSSALPHPPGSPPTFPRLQYFLHAAFLTSIIDSARSLTYFSAFSPHLPHGGQ